MKNLKKKIKSFLTENGVNIYELKNAILEYQNEVAIIWTTEEVMMIRPDLNKEQSLKILNFIKEKYDPNIGVTWETLKNAANILYPVNSIKIISE